MAATRSSSKLSRKWVRPTRKYFLKFLQATYFPPVERPGFGLLVFSELGAALAGMLQSIAREIVRNDARTGVQP
jgi:hypothetical protein